MNRNFIDRLKEILPEEEILYKEPMSNHTTFKTGGAAEIYIAPKVSVIPEIVKLCRETGTPLTVIGNGSNLLVSDEGIQGVVLEIGSNAALITVEECFITAEAGALLGTVSRTAMQQGLCGMEFASGIPGTIGGAVVMNAGAYDGEIKDLIQWADVLTEDGDVKRLSLEELELSYRHSCIEERGYIVLRAGFSLKQGDKDEIRAKIKDFTGRRTSKQPLEYPSAGSTFKRPEGYFAGKLIMDAGLKGYRVGGAMVSEKHCGFVINYDKATSTDIYNLICQVRNTVLEKSGVELVPEVKLLGHFQEK